MRTVVGVFPSRADADHVVHHLHEAGVPSDEITVADANNADHREWSDRNLAAIGGLSAGWFMAWLIPLVAKRNFPAATTFGAAIGGAAGLIAGLISFSVRPGNPILFHSAALTLIAAAAIGIAFGALIAGMYNMGVSHEEIPLQQEAEREHGVVVAAHVDALREPEAVKLMTEHGARGLRDETDAWKASGFTGTYIPDEPYPSDSTVRKHEPR